MQNTLNKRWYTASFVALVACSGAVLAYAGEGTSQHTSSHASSTEPGRAASIKLAAVTPAKPAKTAEPEPTAAKHKAGEVSALGTLGLTIGPPFAYTLEDLKTYWDFRNAATGGSIYLMRKMFRADAPDGAVVPCASAQESAPKKQSDGSFIYKCAGSASGDGTWFARIVPTNDKTFESVICSGSSKDSKILRSIEAACRSIKVKR